ncbi:hypothetical protein L3C95_16750 [Chitinophaga filiformis]|uniref:hypothetical protein n=1 Tax=Chitinophaga filiformis TaxID=104663 RepID=UPI001F430933|nr:hypothetical protein [Chitinophaga filiformis]MCF6404548.1 hypothetical protein [Chitinophaga filiformis]
MKYEQSASPNISEQDKAFRTLISNDPALSYFLETGSIRPNEKFAKEQTYRDPAFLAFISPYFHEVYVNAITSAFDQKDTSLMSDIAINTILLDDAYRKQAFDDILAYLEQRKAALLSFHAKLQMQEPIDILSLTEHSSMATISNLNYLPAEFQEFRSTYARVIMKVVNSLVNRDQRTALTMISHLCQLTVDMQTANDVDALYKLINANRQTSAAESGAGYSGYSNDSGNSDNSGYSSDVDDSRDSGGFSGSIRALVVGFVIFVIIILKMMLFGDSRGYRSNGSYRYHRSYRPSYHPPSYHPSYRRNR